MPARICAHLNDMMSIEEGTEIGWALRVSSQICTKESRRRAMATTANGK